MFDLPKNCRTAQRDDVAACLQDGHKAQHRWMYQLGRLLYIVERNLRINAAASTQQPKPAAAATAQPARPLQNLSTLEARGAARSSTERPLSQALRRPAAQPTSRGFPPPFPSRYSPQGSRIGPQAAVKQPTSKGNALQRVSHIYKDTLAFLIAYSCFIHFQSDSCKFSSFSRHLAPFCAL